MELIHHSAFLLFSLLDTRHVSRGMVLWFPLPICSETKPKPKQKEVKHMSVSKPCIFNTSFLSILPYLWAQWRPLEEGQLNGATQVCTIKIAVTGLISQG